MVSTTIKPIPGGSLGQYEAFWQMWPQHIVLDGERRLIGCELELMASHSADPNHLDPGCRDCCHIRLSLLALAQHIAEHALPKSESRVAYAIDPHSSSVICSPSLQNRSFVSVSVIITDPEAFDRPKEIPDKFVLSTIKQALAEHGVPER